jgi:PTS system nitrogen regulatory IIA component
MDLMDLKTVDVADLLNVSSSAVEEWVLQGKIPFYRFQGEYRFSRIEIEDWVLKGKNQSEEAPAKGNRQFSLYRALHKGGVLHAIPGKSKEEILRSAMHTIAKDLLIDTDVLTEMILDREKLEPTAVGMGIGIPHTRESFAQIPQDCIYIVFPEKPIEDYGALDGIPVNTLFFIFAHDDKSHLHLLAKVAHFSSQEKRREFLSQRPGKIDLLEEIKAWESRLTG